MYPTPASQHRLSLGTQECRHHFAALADSKVKEREKRRRRKGEEDVTLAAVQCELCCAKEGKYIKKWH